MDVLDKITEENFNRMVEIIVNTKSEFPSIHERMGAALSRMKIWENSIINAYEELELSDSVPEV